MPFLFTPTWINNEINSNAKEVEKDEKFKMIISTTYLHTYYTCCSSVNVCTTQRESLLNKLLRHNSSYEMFGFRHQTHRNFHLSIRSWTHGPQWALIFHPRGFPSPRPLFRWGHARKRVPVDRRHNFCMQCCTLNNAYTSEMPHKNHKSVVFVEYSKCLIAISTY